MTALCGRRGALSFVLGIAVWSACANEPAPIVADELTSTRSAVVRAGTNDHVLAALIPAPPEPVVMRARDQCEPGQIRICPHSLPSSQGIVNDGLPPHMTCRRRAADGAYHFDLSDCATPLVIAFDDAPVQFTQPPGAFAVGPFARTEWVSARTPWLARDRDGSGCIESQTELFDARSIAALDDNGDGVLDARDAAFSSLVLWADENQNRRCDISELRSLADAGISAIPVRFATIPPHSFGSHEGEHAVIASTPYANARVVDVYLAPL